MFLLYFWSALVSSRDVFQKHYTSQVHEIGQIARRFKLMKISSVLSACHKYINKWINEDAEEVRWGSPLSSVSSGNVVSLSCTYSLLITSMSLQRKHTRPHVKQNLRTQTFHLLYNSRSLIHRFQKKCFYNKCITVFHINRLPRNHIVAFLPQYWGAICVVLTLVILM